MNADEVTGTVLEPLVHDTLHQAAGRDAVYQALLDEPLLLAFISHQASPAASVRLTGGALTRLVEAPLLKVPVPPLYVSAAAMRAAASDRGFWPDGVERASVFERGAIFPILRGQPGAVVTTSGDALPIDAGEIAALAERQTPAEYAAALKAMVQKGRAREVARRLAVRPLYVLGHPQGGMMLFQQEIAVFLHLATAERFAMRLAEQTGERGQHGLVPGADLFTKAFRGKLRVHVEPGPGSFRLRSVDLR